MVCPHLPKVHKPSLSPAQNEYHPLPRFSTFIFLPVLGHLIIHSLKTLQLLHTLSSQTLYDLY
jgi:hypothetical protein